MGRVKRSGVYLIRNRVNGKCYVGSTNDKASRWARHRRCLRKGDHQNIHLQRAWNQYGEEQFEFLWIVDVPESQLLDEEQQWLDANPDGYNIAKCAEAFNRGRKLGPQSKEHRKKISDALKGRKASAEARKKMSDSQKAISAQTSARLKGKKCSEETKRKISETQRGRTLSDEHRAKISQGLMGNTHTKGHKLTTEQRERISARLKGRVWAEEHRRKAVEGIRRAAQRKKGQLAPAGA